MPGHDGPQFPPGGRYAKLANEFGTNPPPDGIPVVRAQRELRLTNDTIVALIRSGKVRVCTVGGMRNMASRTSRKMSPLIKVILSFSGPSSEQSQSRRPASVWASLGMRKIPGRYLEISSTWHGFYARLKVPWP